MRMLALPRCLPTIWTQESTMIQVLVHHEVADYNRWRAVFDAALDFRHQGGEQSCRIFRKTGDPHDLTLLFDWDTLERAQRYMTSPELRSKMSERRQRCPGNSIPG
jgi:hypothetical protein